MPRYTVTVRRTESIDFEIDAENENDARENYLYAGDEVYSETIDITIENIAEVTA